MEIPLHSLAPVLGILPPGVPQAGEYMDPPRCGKPLRLRLMNATKTFPAAPRILAKVGRSMLMLDTDLEAVAALLRLDPAITLLVMRVANSAAYNQREPFASLEEALARLGFAKAYRLIGVAAVRQLSDQDLPFYGLSGTQLRQNSLLTALLVELLAPVAGVCSHAAYTAGLLRTVGRIALDRLAQSRELQTGWMDGTEVDVEEALFGMNSAQASAMLLEEWHFPAETVRAIREHTDPHSKDRLAGLLNLSAAMAHQNGYEMPGEERCWNCSHERMEYLGLSEQVLQEALKISLKRFVSVLDAVA
jgi:HD-like signal output (HDOD) protein